jgi:hypothetical protein
MSGEYPKYDENKSRILRNLYVLNEPRNIDKYKYLIDTKHNYRNW